MVSITDQSSESTITSIKCKTKKLALANRKLTGKFSQLLTFWRGFSNNNSTLNFAGNESCLASSRKKNHKKIEKSGSRILDCFYRELNRIIVKNLAVFMCVTFSVINCADIFRFLIKFEVLL